MAQAVIGPVSRWHDSGIVGVGPGLWYGPTALDGAAGDWKRAPLGSIYVQVDAAGGTAQTWQKVAKAGATADWKKIAINAATDTFTAGVIKPAADSTTAIQLQNAAGTSVVTVDTTNKRVGVNNTTPEGAMDVKSNALSSAVMRLLASDGSNLCQFWEESDGRVFMQLFDQSQETKIFLDTGANSYFIGGNVGFGTNAPATRVDIDAGALTLKEMAAPGVGAANTVRLYAVDNGAGKTQLMAQFATGSPVQVAIEP